MLRSRFKVLYTQNSVLGKSTGFTLVELLVVIAIIGLLAAVIAVSLVGARAKSRDAKRLTDMRQISTAMGLYYNDYAGYPAAASGSPSGLAPDYVSTLPTDPAPAGTGCSAGYTYTPTGTGYTSPLGGTVYPGFTYTFCLGGASWSTTRGPHTLSDSGIQ
jgi:prepilin-type N-terminal cleavage/methylation domain-containing protein